MDYSSLLIREVIDRVSKLRLLSVYNESIKGDLESTILPLYQQHFENKDVNEALRILKKDFLNRTKRRWLDAAIRDYEQKKPKKNKELIGEYRALTAYYKTNGKNSFANSLKTYRLRKKSLINELISYVNGVKKIASS